MLVSDIKFTSHEVFSCQSPIEKAQSALKNNMPVFLAHALEESVLVMRKCGIHPGTKSDLRRAIAIMATSLFKTDEGLYIGHAFYAALDVWHFGFSSNSPADSEAQNQAWDYAEKMRRIARPGLEVVKFVFKYSSNTESPLAKRAVERLTKQWGHANIEVPSRSSLSQFVQEWSPAGAAPGG